MKKPKEQVATKPLSEIRLQPESVTGSIPKENLLRAIELKNKPESVTDIEVPVEGPEVLHVKKQELFEQINEAINFRLYNPDLILKTPLENFGMEFSIEEAETVLSLIAQYQRLLNKELDYFYRLPDPEKHEQDYSAFIEGEVAKVDKIWKNNFSYTEGLREKKTKEAEKKVYQDIYEGKTDIAHKYELAELAFEKEVKPRLRQAKVGDYQEWLSGFFRKNGTGTDHKYTYAMPINRWFLAKEDFRMIPLYGATSLSIIVPKGIKYLGGNLGHCELYFMEDYTNTGSRVPVYEDTPWL